MALDPNNSAESIAWSKLLLGTDSSKFRVGLSLPLNGMVQEEFGFAEKKTEAGASVYSVSLIVEDKDDHTCPPI